MTSLTLPVSQIPRDFMEKINPPVWAEQIRIIFETKTKPKQAEILESSGEVFDSWEDFVAHLKS